MAEMDYPPSRIGAGKRAMTAFLERRRVCRPENVLSVVAFNFGAWWVGSVNCICDPRAVDDLQRLLGSLQPEGGTDLSGAFTLIRDGVQDRFRRIAEEDSPSVPVRVLVLTDGHSNGDPVPHAGFLKQQGVVIEIVGIGGSPAAVNEPMLKQCASIENGCLLYRFIGDQGGGTEALVEHFTGIALR
jgi:hypothetical protein